MNIANSVATYLAAEGLGAAGISIFANFLPEVAGTSLCVYSTGGYDVNPVNGYDEPTVQILVRSLNPDDATALLAQAYNVLQALHRKVLPGDTHVVYVRALQTAPQGLGRDEQERHEFTQNYRLRIRNKTRNRV